MKIPHENFCVLPWISLEASPIGTVRPCCLAEQEILDDQGRKFDLATAQLSTVQDSQHMRDLRRQFLAGDRPDACRKCWNEEAAGRSSKRMHTLERLQNMIDHTEWSESAKPLQFLDLKLGNICNLRCRICGSWSSSTFATEEVQHLPAEQRRASFHYEMLRRGQWPRENTQFWQQIDQLVDEIRYIEFTGGEPFMIDQHFDLLQAIIKRGRADQVEIHYNTNGTQWPVRGPDIWQHFRTIEIAFSIDDVGPRFEYQRTNASWPQVCDNLARFRDLRSKSSNIQIQCCSTVNVYNVLYLAELADWIDAQAFDFVYWNILHQAEHLSVCSMPQSIKNLAHARLSEARVSQFHRVEFDRIIGFMNQGFSHNKDRLVQQIRQLDQRRGSFLRDHHPELAAALDHE